MFRGSGVATGRTELLVVLLIAAAGLAAAGTVALLPWHPQTRVGPDDTSAVIRLDSPQGHHVERVDHLRRR